ncbi:MAG: DUF6796 family protein [Acidiferrobacterales bacterium]
MKLRLTNNGYIASIVAGCIGLLAAVLVGTGEFLLHFDPMARYAGGYVFFEAVSESRATLGHFIGVLGAPLYLFGVWHVAKMLQPASKFWSSVAFFVMSYGFMVGAVWIGSRSSAAALVAIGQDPAAAGLIALYDLRYETLLTVIRIAALVFSLIFISLILTGRTAYPRWMAVFNPIVLIIANFLVFWLLPDIGKYLMPIALNVSFFIIFALSVYIESKNHRQVTHV